jgi:hypothetical protein
MSATHSHRWIAWLLPLFLLRAFVPVGFMVSWSADGLQVVMCSGGGPVPTPADVSLVASQQHHSDSHTGGQHQRNATMCPFAVAGNCGALPSFDPVVAFVATVSHEVREFTTLDLPAAAVLIDRIRGPPLS